MSHQHTTSDQTWILHVKQQTISIHQSMDLSSIRYQASHLYFLLTLSCIDEHSNHFLFKNRRACLSPTFIFSIDATYFTLVTSESNQVDYESYRNISKKDAAWPSNLTPCNRYARLGPTWIPILYKSTGLFSISASTEIRFESVLCLNKTTIQHDFWATKNATRLSKWPSTHHQQAADWWCTCKLRGYRLEELG